MAQAYASLAALRAASLPTAAVAHLAPVPDGRGIGGRFVVFDADPYGGGDDGGVVIELANGNFAVRQMDGLDVNVRWFGAVGDYDTDTATGTDDTAAFMAAVAFVNRLKAKIGAFNWQGRSVTLTVPAGGYLVTQKHLFNFTGALRWRMRGAGDFASVIYFDCDEATGGTDNFLFYNNNGWGFCKVQDVGFVAVNNTERLYYMYSTGTAQRQKFKDCAFVNFEHFFWVEGTATADIWRIIDCEIQQDNINTSYSTFFHSDNNQSVGNLFEGNQYLQFHGTIFDVEKGGSYLSISESVILVESGRLLRYEGDGTGIGPTNGLITFCGIKTELRDDARLLDMECAAAVVFEDSILRTITPGNEALVRGRITQTGIVKFVQCSLAYPIELYASGGSGFAAPWRARAVLRDCEVDRQIADLFPTVLSSLTFNEGALPKVDALGCDLQSRMGTPADYYKEAVDVYIHARKGYNPTVPPVKRMLLAFDAAAGLPDLDDTGLTFRLPRGALLQRVRIVKLAEGNAAPYTWTVQDSAATTLVTLTGSGSGMATAESARIDREITSDPARVFTLTSSTANRREGFVEVEYI